MGRGRKPKYVNERFFDKESPNMYYVLGASFGLVTFRSKRITFRSKNRELIDIIKRELDSGHKIVNVKDRERDRNSYQLEVYGKNSIYLINSLKSRGLNKNKSEREFPKNIDESYLPHFDRGFFDAKGIIMNKNQRNNLVFNFNNKFLVSLNDSLRKYAEVKQKDPNGSRIGYGHTDSIKIHDFIYSNLEDRLYLKEKKEKFSLNHKNITDTERIKIELLNGKSVEELRKELGYSTSQSFYTFFRKIFGITVGRFLKKELGHDNRLYNGLNLNLK